MYHGEYRRPRSSGSFSRERFLEAVSTAERHGAPQHAGEAVASPKGTDMATPSLFWTSSMRASAGSLSWAPAAMDPKGHTSDRIGFSPDEEVMRIDMDLFPENETP